VKKTNFLHGVRGTTRMTQARKRQTTVTKVKKPAHYW